jgi:hypothetical protein
MSNRVRSAARSGASMTRRSLEPREVWALLECGDARLLDLRTEVERRHYGAPPGAVSVSLARHLLSPDGQGTIYLCQHAVRSKATLRNGAAEVAGGFGDRLACRSNGFGSDRRPFRRQPMEPLWSPVVATGGNRSQIACRGNRRNQAKTLPSVATSCGKERW